MEIAFDFSSTLEKRENATTNLLVLAKENAGTTFITIILSIQIHNVSIIGGELLVKEGIFEKISALLKRETTPSIVITSIRIVSALCKGNLSRVRILNPI